MSSSTNFQNTNQNHPTINFLNVNATNVTNVQATSSNTSSSSTNSDFLNTSQNEKSWLNSSHGERGFLNNSLSLPPELRYQALTDLVTKIVEDADMLAASGRDGTLNFAQLKNIPVQQSQSFEQHRAANHQHHYHQYQHPTNKFQYTHAHQQSLNRDRPNYIINTNNLQQITVESQKQSVNLAQQQFEPNPVNLDQNQQPINANNTTRTPNAPFYRQIPQPPAIYHTQPQQQYPNSYNQLNYNTNTNSNNAENVQLYHPVYDLESGGVMPSSSSSSSSSNTTANHYHHQFSSPPFSQYQNSNNNPFNNISLYHHHHHHNHQHHNHNQHQLPNDFTKMTLAYPPSFSHHLATLTPDQQNYLLQQQRELVMHLAFNETKLQQQQQHQHQHQQMNNNPYSKSNSLEGTNNTLALNNNNNNNNSSIVNNRAKLVRTPTNSSSSTSSSKSSSSYSNNSETPNENVNVNTTYNFQPNSINSSKNQENFKYFIPYQINPNVNFTSTLNHLHEELIGSNILIDQENNFFKFNPNSEKMRLLMVKQQPPAYKQHRRTGPANELHIRLEQCIYQLKCIEAERKKIETELFHVNLNRLKFASTSNNSGGVTNYNGSISNSNNNSYPRLPPNPSRVDRLIVESWREHSKVICLISKMENLKSTIFYANIQSTVHKWLQTILNVQARRKDEIMNSANKVRLINGTNGQTTTVRAYDEKDVTILASSINELAQMITKTRTSLWCALQIGNLVDNRHHQTLANSSTAASAATSLGKNETIFNTFDTEENTKAFIRDTLEIKTDLISRA